MEKNINHVQIYVLENRMDYLLFFSMLLFSI